MQRMDSTQRLHYTYTRFMYCYMELRLCFPVQNLLKSWINSISIILNIFYHSQSQQRTLLGTIPREAMIHQRVLTFFGNISRLPESSVENQLADRQLTVKTLDSNSWFVEVSKLCQGGQSRGRPDWVHGHYAPVIRLHR